jgi:hypothetical protein
MVAGIAVCQSINTSQYRHSTAAIGQAIEPLLKRVVPRRRQVVCFVESHFRF